MLSAFHQGMVHWEITTVYIVIGLLVSVIKSAKSDVCCCDTVAYPNKDPNNECIGCFLWPDKVRIQSTTHIHLVDSLRRC